MLSEIRERHNQYYMISHICGIKKIAHYQLENNFRRNIPFIFLILDFSKLKLGIKAFFNFIRKGNFYYYFMKE